MLEFKNINLKYNSKQILSNVNLKIEEGTITSIIGLNGCGKTTLLKLALKLIYPDCGQILYNGLDIKNISLKEFAKLFSYLPQSRDIPLTDVKTLVMHGRYPHMSFPRTPTKNDDEIVDYAMKLMNVDNFSSIQLNHLSGGERQRVYFAMIIAQESKFLFLDEPATYFDINYQIELINILEKLKKQSKTTVMVCHDILQALSSSDYIILMDKGSVAMCGNPNEIYESRLIDKIFQIEISKKNIDGFDYYFILRKGF